MAAGPAQVLDVVQDGAVLRVGVPCADGDVLTLDTCDALADLLLRPPAGAHVAVLSTTGRSFCLGRERTAATAQTLPGEVARLVAVNEALLRSPLVTVTRVHADAAGFGVGLAALADVAVASASARFWFPEVGLGLAPALVLAWLPRLVGRREAFWLTATGAVWDADRAVAGGLVNEVVPEPDLDAAVERRVAALAERSPRVHAEIRSMLRAAATLTEEQAYELASDRLVVGSLRRGTA